MDYIDALEEVAEASKIIFDVASQTYRNPIVSCPHGESPRYPADGWWCDDCFGRLEKGLEVLEESRLASLTTACTTDGAVCPECEGTGDNPNDGVSTDCPECGGSGQS